MDARTDTNHHGIRREGGHVLEMQRRRLLLAFSEVAAEKGLEGAGVGRVCTQAGVSRRTFYDLFDNREECLLATLDAAIELAREHVLPIWNAQRRWHERIRSALDALLDLFAREPALARVCMVESLKAGPMVAARRRHVLDALERAVEEGRKETKRGSAPPPLTAQSTVGGVIAVIHARLLEGDDRPLTELTGPLTSMIVHAYLGAATAQRELNRSQLHSKSVLEAPAATPIRDPFKDLSIRLTLRTARVLGAIAAHPGASNRLIGDAAGIPDQGQTSKLLRRLQSAGLLDNQGNGHATGEPNAWQLTEHGHAIQNAINN